MKTVHELKITGIVECYIECLKHLSESEAEEHARKMAQSHCDSATIEEGIVEAKKVAKQYFAA